MRKIRSILLIIGLISLLAGCGGAPSASPNGEGDAGQAGKLSVYTSFYTMSDFASKIGGDKVELVNMVPSGTEPHDWEPTAADIAGLEKADVFIYNGAGLEHWAEDVLKSLRNEELIALEASKGVNLVEGRHGEGEEDQAGQDKDEHEETEYDPHVWLNPLNAKSEMENIKNALVQADPANREYYEANYEKYAVLLDKLDREFKDALSSLPKKDIIVSHEAFGYLCAAYGLNQIGIEGLSPDSEPDPGRMAEIIEFAKDNDVKVIFFEELVNPKVSETIADALGAKTAVLSPIEGLSDEQRKNGDDYFAVMRQNLEALKEALR